MVDAIGTTASSGKPVNRTVLAMARSSVRLDPARYGVPGNETRPSLRKLAIDAADRVPPWRAPGGGDRIGHQNRPVQPFRANHRLHRRPGKVMAVGDQAGEQRIGRKKLPDHVGMPRQHLRTSVAEMGCQRRARRDRIAELLRRRCGVADRDAHTCRDQVVDERQGARHFRRERDEDDATLSGVLAPLEVVDACGCDVLQWMCTARAVSRRYVRSFHMDAGDGRVG